MVLALNAVSAASSTEPYQGSRGTSKSVQRVRGLLCSISALSDKNSSSAHLMQDQPCLLPLQ